MHRRAGPEDEIVVADELPPLNALRAFEAAGRHLSVTKAAQELHVTPAAVSHQVKALEDHLGVALFRRSGNALFLTDAGQACLPGLRAGFAELVRAIDAVREHDARGSLVLSVAPVFAAKWLIPRLASFQASHPEIDVRLSASLALADLERDGIDAAIRVSRGRHPGLVAERLFGESVAPMCSPALLAGPTPLRDPGDLRHHVLLHWDWPGSDRIAPDWDAWLRATNVSGVDATRGPRFAQPDHAMQAAIEGAGVVLGWRTMAADDLAAGRLVVPFDRALALDVAFHLVYPELRRDAPKLVAFRRWLLREADSDPGGATSARP